MAEPAAVEKFEEIAWWLDVTYGPRPFQPNRDFAGELVGTILSQSTNDRNSTAAFRSLREKYPTWSDVRDAPLKSVVSAIAIGGLANQKAPRIQHVLAVIGDTNDVEDQLEAMSVDQAMDFLTDLAGVGPKTAACVLLFAFGKPVMPVDTHIARVMTRLGILTDHTSTVTKQRLLTSLLGPESATIFALHKETIEHGRTLCHARTPKCEACGLSRLCNYFKDQQRGSQNG